MPSKLFEQPSTRTAKHMRLALLAGLLTILFIFPAFSNEYILFLILSVLIFVIFCLGTNILLGYTGLLSFGQGAFYGAGAYASAKILLIFPNIMAGLLGGVVAAGLLAMVLGWFAIRHTAIYFAMITLAFSMMIWAFVQRWSFLGTYHGLKGIPRAPFEIPHLFSINLQSTTSYYFFVVIISLIAIFLCYRLMHSPLGLTLQGIRENESRLALTGFWVKRGRWISFVISGLFCGLAGALSATLTGTVTPLTLHWETSISPVIGSLLGGILNFSGPIVGGTVYFIMKEMVTRYTINWMLPMGMLTLVIVLGFRKGIVGSIQQDLIPRLRARFRKVTGDERSIVEGGGAEEVIR